MMSDKEPQDANGAYQYWSWGEDVRLRDDDGAGGVLAGEEVARRLNEGIARDQELAALRGELEVVTQEIAAARDWIAAAYSEGFNDAWVLTLGMYADDDLIREQFAKSLAAEEAEHE